MYRVELKVLVHKFFRFYNSLFLMYRVELKGSNKKYYNIRTSETVPNVPCGVESLLS